MSCGRLFYAARYCIFKKKLDKSNYFVLFGQFLSKCRVEAFNLRFNLKYRYAHTV
jgi:hypothetical protein